MTHARAVTTAAGAVSWSAPADPLFALVWGGLLLADAGLWLAIIISFPFATLVAAIAILAVLLILQAERKAEETHAAMLARLPKLRKGSRS